MRSAKAMGIATVAIFSEADRKAPHVRFADEAVCVGPAPSKESYLKMDTIIEKALELGVDGIHPGYGFLSENAIFAQKVTDAGITFIGPSPTSIEIMGNKLAAKQAVKKFDVPMVPGIDEPVSDINVARDIARRIGYPVLVKASAGGGGKGMRLVHKDEDLEEQMQMAISEAVSSFGDGSVFIEKFVTSPRHIEIQIMGDQHGNIVYLFERECSIQRRHQKVVEEAPSAVVSPAMRKAMGEAAVKVAQSVNYYGAGTVEFIVDADLNFYFLEMNTRLQVEHPVTEMITGKDLVQEQIRVARGEQLSFTQESLQIIGHAIELRVYAEDPANNFLPDIGLLTTYRKPHGNGIRVDDGMEEGMEIPIYYDPMIAKLAAFGLNRSEAIEKMKEAIEQYQIVGAKTTLPFGTFVMNHPAFISGQFDTNFVAQYFHPQEINEKEGKMAAILSALIYSNRNEHVTFSESGNQSRRSKWKMKRILG